MKQLFSGLIVHALTGNWTFVDTAIAAGFISVVITLPVLACRLILPF